MTAGHNAHSMMLWRKPRAIQVFVGRWYWRPHQATLDALASHRRDNPKLGKMRKLRRLD